METQLARNLTPRSLFLPCTCLHRFFVLPISPACWLPVCSASATWTAAIGKAGVYKWSCAATPSDVPPGWTGPQARSLPALSMGGWTGALELKSLPAFHTESLGIFDGLRRLCWEVRSERRGAAAGVLCHVQAASLNAGIEAPWCLLVPAWAGLQQTDLCAGAPYVGSGWMDCVM